MGVLYPEPTHRGHHPLDLYSLQLAEQNARRESQQHLPELARPYRDSQHSASPNRSRRPSSRPTEGAEGSIARDTAAFDHTNRSFGDEQTTRSFAGSDVQRTRRPSFPVDDREIRGHRRYDRPSQSEQDLRRARREERRRSRALPASDGLGDGIQCTADQSDAVTGSAAEEESPRRHAPSSLLNAESREHSDRATRKQHSQSPSFEQRYPEQRPVLNPRDSRTGSEDVVGSSPPERQYSAHQPVFDADIEGQAESASHESHRHHESASGSSVWDEVEFYKYGRIPEEPGPRRRCCCSDWSRRTLFIVVGSIAALLVLVIAVPVAVVLSRKPYSYTASLAQVSNPQAFTTGGATHRNPGDVNDGIGAGRDEYTYYTGNASNFPSSSKWVSFGDMWNSHLDTLQNSCGWLNEGSDNSAQVINDIYTAIQDRANASLVDHRFIFAVVLQESNGCVHVGSTISSGGVRNPGLMQSHNGHSYDGSHSAVSIMAMIQDGTQGTEDGPGLVQYLNKYGNPYDAARGYNSGHIAAGGDLSAAAGATACYVSDIANRLTGWVTAKSTCPGDTT